MVRLHQKSKYDAIELHQEKKIKMYIWSSEFGRKPLPDIVA